MEPAGQPDISQMINEQGDLLCQLHDQLVQLGTAMEDVLRSLQRLNSGGYSKASLPKESAHEPF